MSQPITFIICSTFHEPQFRLKNLVKSALPIIKSLFSKTIVCSTPSTGDEIRNFLTREGFEVVLNSSTRQVDTYRHALKTVIDYIDNPQTQKIFFIDFDRLIHWIYAYPDELTKIIRRDTYNDADYLHIGRTLRAFETHPETQKKTEIIINEIGSKVLEFIETKDIISVCSIFTKDLGERILKLPNPTAKGFYGTWPILFWNWASTKRYVEVEGLEWETPDRFNKEIADKGYKEWLNQFQTPSEWKKRVQFIRDFLLELSQLTEFEFHLKIKNSKKEIKKN